MRELTDRQLMPSDLWGVSGKTLEDSMQHAILRSAKLSLLEQFFLHKLSPAYSDLLMERAVQMLYASGGQMAIEEVSQRLHLGRRQLEKRFLLTTSQTPVQMRQLVRFQRVVKALMRDPFAKELETALLHGYYDHAHFIKNFRQFSGAAPQIYLRKAREKTHFYNSSIRTSDNIHSLATSERKNSHVYINR
ncbi:MAG: helix-turn-helix domain-containing protein [Burkholderiaceae bacterium]